MSDTLKLFLSLIPLIICTLIAFWLFIRQKEDENDINSIIQNSTVSVREQSTIKVEGKKLMVSGKLDEKKQEMEIYEFPYTMDVVLAFAIGMAIVAAFTSIILFKAGPLLMLYLACLAAYLVFQYVDGWLYKKRFELNIEYLEKMREVSSFLSAGKSIDESLKEACKGNISPVLKRELETVLKDVFTGTKRSTAFMSMYNRLKIEDIQKYSQTLRTYEKTSGNLIRIMAINDRYSKQRIEIQNEQNVFASSQKNSQKIIVGIPLAMVLFMAVFNPSFFGDFYSTIIGQLIGIVAITVLVVGLKRSSTLARGGD